MPTARVERARALPIHCILHVYVYNRQREARALPMYWYVLYVLPTARVERARALPILPTARVDRARALPIHYTVYIIGGGR